MKDRPALDRWLKRLLLAAAWLFVAFDFSCVLREIVNTPPGDFASFYFAGRLAGSGRISQLNHKPAYEPLLAEMRAHHEVLRPRQSYYFLRPAWVAFLYVPYSWLPYRTASLVAIAVNVLLLGVFVWKAPLWFPFPDFFGVGLFRALLCMFVGFRAAIGHGQDTMILVLLLAYGLHLTFQNRQIQAGIALALCSFKPHLIFALPLALLASGKRKTLYSFLAAGSALAAFSLAALGPQGVREWIALLRDPSTNYLPGTMANIRAVVIHFGWPVGAAGVVVVLAAFGFILRRGSFADQVAAALIVAPLLSPHNQRYDLSLLAIVALLAGHAAPRYILLLPWLNFYPRLDLLPMAFGSMVYLVYLAAKPMLAARQGDPSSAEAAQDPGAAPAELLWRQARNAE